MKQKYRIYIDQGHNPTGYHNTGAEGFGITEQDVTYMVGAYLADILVADGRFETMKSRNTSVQVLGTNSATSLQERVNQANVWEADYYISIHTNSSEDPEENGTDAMVYSFDSPAEPLARQIVNQITRRLETKDNGVTENSSMYVLRYTTMPAVLLELGYITNERENTLLQEKQYQYAYGIYKGLIIYLGIPAVS